MIGHDHRAALIAQCDECGAPSGAPCRDWAGFPAFVPCPLRLAVVRRRRDVVLVDWLELLAVDLARYPERVPNAA